MAWLAVAGTAAEVARAGPAAGAGGFLLGALEVLRLAFVLGVLGAVASLVVRFRRARGVERQQLKWFVYAAILVVVVLVLTTALLAHPMEGPLGSILWGAAPVCLCAAVAVAVLRYRLYGIDRIVNRTLVYGLLTAALGAVYAGGVSLVGPLLSPAGRDSQLAVAVVTLAVAALFQPLRRRLQAVVDRRFNRRRYHTAQVVAGFSARLRDEIELDTLSDELLAIVRYAMQPARARLWLRR